MDDDDALPPHAARLERSAQRIATPTSGGRMAWRCWGEGQPVVLLHGGSGSWTHWLRTIEPLVARGRRVCVPDIPGFGDSDRVGPDADSCVEPVLQGLRTVAGPGPHEVVAFSFGSLVTVLLAADHPDAVSRALLVGAPVEPLARTGGVALRSWRGLATVAERDAAHRHNLAAIMIHDPAAIDAEAVRLQRLNAERDNMRERRLVTTDIFQRTLARVQCGFSSLYGEEDALYRGHWPRIAGIWERFPRFGGQVIIPGAGHWVQYEGAGAFDAELARWLAMPRSPR